MAFWAEPHLESRRGPTNFALGVDKFREVPAGSQFSLEENHTPSFDCDSGCRLSKQDWAKAASLASAALG